MKCQVCGLYSHLKCSRVEISQLESLLQEVNSKLPFNQQLCGIENVYKCFDCLISGKTINFLILESCLHYENIHHII
jgi:hypothetical protein